MRKLLLVASNFVPEHCPSENHVIHQFCTRQLWASQVSFNLARLLQWWVSFIAVYTGDKTKSPAAINLVVPLLLIHFCLKEMQPEYTKGFQEREVQLPSYPDCFLTKFLSAATLLMNIRKLKTYARWKSMFCPRFITASQDHFIAKLQLPG